MDVMTRNVNRIDIENKRENSAAEIQNKLMFFFLSVQKKENKKIGLEEARKSDIKVKYSLIRF